MLVLASTDVLSIITGQAASIDVHADWFDDLAGVVTPGDTNTPTISTAATTTVVPSPAASTLRAVESLSIRNRHASTACDVTVVHNNGAQAPELNKQTLQPGESLTYDGGKFRHFLAGGVLKNQFDPAAVRFTGKTIVGIQEPAVAAGDAIHASLYFPPGVLQTTPTIGDLEFDGKTLYFTPATGMRGSLAPLHIRMLAADLTAQNVTTAQPWFPTDPQISLPVATAYRFRGRLICTYTASISAVTTALLFGGTATLTFITYEANWRTTAANAAAAANAIRAASADSVNTHVGTGTSSANDVDVWVEGVILVNAAGTLVPQLTFSGTETVATVKAGTFFELMPIGPNTGLTLGNWS
jgi:hypothetical protein